VSGQCGFWAFAAGGIAASSLSLEQKAFSEPSRCEGDD